MEDLPSLEEALHAKRSNCFLGRGAFREVYHIPGTKWVYKFEEWFREDGINVREYKNFKQYSDSFSTKEIVFPEFVLLNPEVIASEYVDGVLARDFCEGYGTCVCVREGLSRCWRQLVAPIELKIPDLHGRNVKYSSEHKKIFIIDIGGYAS